MTGLARRRSSSRSFPAVGHTPAFTNTTTSACDYSTAMAPIDRAIAFLESTDSQNISEVARKCKIERSTLSKHFHGKRSSNAKANEKKQLLDSGQ